MSYFECGISISLSLTMTSPRFDFLLLIVECLALSALAFGNCGFGVVFKSLFLLLAILLLCEDEDREDASELLSSFFFWNQDVLLVRAVFMNAVFGRLALGLVFNGISGAAIFFSSASL